MNAHASNQALSEACAMVADLAGAQTLADLDNLYMSWIVYSTLEETPPVQTFDELRGVLSDYIREFCYDCGVHCADAGLTTPKDDA